MELRNQVLGLKDVIFRTAESLKSRSSTIRVGEKPGFSQAELVPSPLLHDG